MERQKRRAGREQTLREPWPVSNVSAAVLDPRIPHVESTTILIAQRARAEIGGPRFNVPYTLLGPLALQAQLGMSWLAAPGPGVAQGPPWTCMWPLAAAMCIRFHVTGKGCTLDRLERLNGYCERVDGLTDWLAGSPGSPQKLPPESQEFPGGGCVGPAVQHLAPCRLAG